MILNKYLAKRFLFSFLAVFAIFLALTMMISFLEHLRMFGGRDLGLAQIALFVVLIAPSKIFEIIPLIMVIASIAVFLSLTRSSELVIARAAGRSAARFLLAPALTAFMIGVFMVTIFNPIVAGTSQRYENELAQVNGMSSSLLRVTADGIWLRQAGDGEQTLIHAERGSLNGSALNDVTFLVFTSDGAPLRRIEANEAALFPGEWQLDGVVTWSLQTGQDATERRSRRDTLVLPTNLTLNQIRDSFGTPSSVSIWQLPGFIAQLDRAGFSAQRHIVWFQVQMALPAFLVAVTLIGAAFTIKPSRLQNGGLMVLFAILAGFGLYFVRNFAKLLAENGQLDPGLSAWVPPLAAIGLAMAMILQREDG